MCSSQFICVHTVYTFIHCVEPNNVQNCEELRLCPIPAVEGDDWVRPGQMLVNLAFILI